MTFTCRHLLLLLLLPLVQPAFAVPKENPPTVSQSEDAKALAENESGSRFAQDIMLQALGLIGVTYRWGGASPESGLDCSGFIKYVFQQSMNIALPHNAFAISRLGEDVEKEALKPGDLVFFNTLGRRFSHVGIYLGDDRFIHSPSKGSKVQVVRLSDAYWAKRFTGARRVTQESVAERTPQLSQPMSDVREVKSSGKKSRKGGKAPKKQGKKKAKKKKR
ncbi:NlpC/P60 family protein [Chitinimonas arctica]|uniref:NlpC/P60 family protein n=1 Tax=Chitinimonas arctica TaxID=2594795 RepID=A0A516SAD3_9NEIS|nr:C40 family peptidase [Chitinimonas arctica]QDQ25111.1 NlpC/P60 family protein [Chitinimonas arctica]